MIDKYPKMSPMGIALDRYWMAKQLECRNASDGEYLSWQSTYNYINTALFREHQAYMAPATNQYKYVTFRDEQDKTAFLLKWG